MENPPSSGLSRSIRDLFENLTPPEGGNEEVAESPSDRGDPPFLLEDPPASGEDRNQVPGNPASTEAKPEPEMAAGARFSTLVARYMNAEPGEKRALASGIREGAEGLRAAGETAPLAEAAVALSLLGEGGPDDEAVALARDLVDPAVASWLAVRIGTERDPDERERLHEVARRQAPVMAPALTDALADAEDRSVRRALIDAVRTLGEPGREAVLTLLEDDRWYAVRNGVILLGEMGDPDAVQALTVPLGHADPRVRRETVLALAKLGGEDAGLLLVGMLEDGASEVRAAAATGVGILGVGRSQRVLEEMLEKEEAEEVIVAVIRALGQLGDPGPVPALEKRATGSLFTRPPKDVRIAAYRALAAIRTPRARSILDAGAEDKDPEVRYAVTMILKQMGVAADGATGEPDEAPSQPPTESEDDGSPPPPG